MVQRGRANANPHVVRGHERGGGCVGAETQLIELAMGETTGFVKFIADAKTDELLGAHLIGPNVSELCAEVVLAFEYRGSSEDIGVTVHSHPTLSEAVKEAALGVLGRAIHL